jgi:flagellar protein FlbT
MSNLVLEIKQGEMMVVNGAAIRFRTKTRIELASRARFLFGKQLMSQPDVTTPTRQIYYALQTAYVGSEAERGPALEKARRLINDSIDATGSPSLRLVLERVIEAAESDECYAGLKLARRLVRHEDALERGQIIPESDLTEGL